MKLIKIGIPLTVLVIVFVGYDLNRAREVNALPFNENLERISIENDLIGKTEKEVILVLGEPTYRNEYEDNAYTLNYPPSRFLPINKFQAHFKSNGTLRSIKLMD